MEDIPKIRRKATLRPTPRTHRIGPQAGCTAEDIMGKTGTSRAR